MDRNSVIGLLLIGAIMVVFTMVNQPDREALEKQKIEQAIKDSIAATQQKMALPASQDSLEFTNNPAYDSSLTSVVQVKKEIYSLENEHVKLDISSVGGIPQQIELKQFQTWEKSQLMLFQEDSSLFSFSLPLLNKSIQTNTLPFYKTEASGANGLVLRTDIDSSNYFTFSYELKDEYSISFTADFSGAAALIPGNFNGVPINIRFTGRRQEKNIENERNNTTLYYRDLKEEAVDKLSPLESASETLENNLEWIAFKEQFFALAMISEKGFLPGGQVKTIALSGDSLTKSMHAALTVPVDAAKPVVKLNLFSGPTQYHLLRDQGHDLQDLIPLGWGIFGWVNKLIVIPAFKFLGKFNLSFGIVILLLTIYIKLILLAFQYRSYLSQAKMRVLKPEIDEINAQYANADAMQKQQAVMNLYREAGVNPLGGCVPMLFQIPVLFALFSFFPAAIELRQQGFLWADDLSTYDSIVNLPFTIPFYGDHVSLFALLMTISTIIYTRMNNQLSAGSNEMMAGLKWMMYLMPVIFLFVLNSYAAGLNYYYFLANIITFAQQFAFRKLVDDKKIHAKIQAKKSQPKKASKSTFQQKLEEMAKAKQAGKR